MQRQQETPGWCVGMGEPKYFVNGSVYDKSWGRPQRHGLVQLHVGPSAVWLECLGGFLCFVTYGTGGFSETKE